MKQFFLDRSLIVLLCLIQGILGTVAYGQSTGELAYLIEGEPAMYGQACNDHFFVRNNYDDTGIMVTYDNTISFRNGDVQAVWFHLDDDAIYENATVQALTPIAYNLAGDLYNEITYNSFQFEIYLPQGLELTINEFDETFVQGDRMPNTTNLTWGKKENPRVVDGKNYDVYTVVAYNANSYGSHLSARNANRYRQHGALKKDHTVFALYIRNNNQAAPEGQIDDIILANMILNFRESFIVDWDSNQRTFFYGTGGNNRSQRFMKYNRIKTYGSQGMAGVLATDISLNTNNLTLEVDDTSQLQATVYPSNATNKTVTWKSSNTAVATVSNNGVVRAISPGTAYITVSTTDGSNLSATCKVTVTERKATSISLNKSSLSLYVFQTAQLTATVYPTNAANRTVSWRSSNSSVATVDDNGLVSAVGSGDATITATTNDGTDLSASCSVAVSIIPATSISLNQTDLTLDVNENYQLVATIKPTNATYKAVTWKSSNTSIATVSSSGLVTPKKPGTVKITATTTDGTNLSASCQVTVVKLVTSVTLSENSLTLIIPASQQLTAYIIPSDATNKTLNWTSSDNSVATVDNNGIVTPVAVGNATIKATTTDGSNLSASCQVTVKKQYVTAITLNETNLVMHIDETAQLIAEITPDNASDKTLAWSSGNTAVARVDNNGLITAVAGGTTYIRARAVDGSDVYADCVIEVLPDYYITLDSLSHIRGSLAQVMDLPLTLVNKSPISGIQFDVTLPSNVEFNLIDGSPDVWLDEARSTRSHSVSTNQLSSGKYRVLVTSSSSKDLKGNDGVLVHMNMVLPQMHNTGDSYINISNIIAFEADETRHTMDDKSAKVSFYYLVGDADANAVVDIADHTSTASKILGKSPSPFYDDAANVDDNYSLDVVDLVGITNIALEIKPRTVRQAPRSGGAANRLFCDKLKLNAAGEGEITVGIDCGFDFAGFQMDMELPHGLTFVGASLGEDATPLGLTAEKMADGMIRFLGTSFSDAEISGVCPKLMTIRVKADEGVVSGPFIEFSDILFAERDLTAHLFDGSCIEYIEPSTIHELMDEVRIYVENGNIIVDTPVAGTVQLIAVDGRHVNYQAHSGHNVYAVGISGIYIVNFNGKTLKVRL